MRVASYNIFEGARDTYSLMKEFVIQQELDVLCVQEANGWHLGRPSRLTDFAASTGLTNYMFGDSNTESKLATFSRLPIVEASLHTEKLWHCAVQAVIQDRDRELALWNVHLNPFDEDERLQEARFITAHALGAIVMGDMNSLARVDKYPDSLLDDLTSQGNKRYGDTALRYDVTDHYSSAGFVDAAAVLGANVKTVPTHAMVDVIPPETLRLDYMFVPDQLMSAIKGIQVIKNEVTNKISDHFPVVMTL